MPLPTKVCWFPERSNITGLLQAKLAPTKAWMSSIRLNSEWQEWSMVPVMPIMFLYKKLYQWKIELDSTLCWVTHCEAQKAPLSSSTLRDIRPGFIIFMPFDPDLSILLSLYVPSDWAKSMSVTLCVITRHYVPMFSDDRPVTLHLGQWRLLWWWEQIHLISALSPQCKWCK